jgi:hypothetical protein
LLLLSFFCWLLLVSHISLYFDRTGEKNPPEPERSACAVSDKDGADRGTTLLLYSF